MLEQLLVDRPYLENKYHKTTEPFNAFARMAYHGWEGDPATGLDDREMAETLKAYVDTFLYDVKHITEAGHLRCTGRSNRKIIDNLRRLSGAGARVEIRMPLFPGHNDDTETLHGVGALLSGVRITKMRLLPYNDCAHSKYASLSLPDTMPKVPLPDRSHVESCAEILRGYGIKVITE